MRMNEPKNKTRERLLAKKTPHWQEDKWNFGQYLLTICLPPDRDKPKNT